MPRISVPLAETIRSKCCKSPLGDNVRFIEPVQSALTEYEPFIVTRSDAPLTLTVDVASVFPLPSKLCAPIAANGPTSGDGATRKPVAVNAKLPLSVCSEQLVSAF